MASQLTSGSAPYFVNPSSAGLQQRSTTLKNDVQNWINSKMPDLRDFEQSVYNQLKDDFRRNNLDELWKIIDDIPPLVDDAGSAVPSDQALVSRALIDICKNLLQTCIPTQPRAILLWRHAEALCLVKSENLAEVKRLLREARDLLKKVLRDAIDLHGVRTLHVEYVRDDVSEIEKMLALVEQFELHHASLSSLQNPVDSIGEE